MTVDDLGKPVLFVDRLLSVYPHEILKVGSGDTVVIVSRGFESKPARIAAVVDDADHLCGVVSLGDIVRSVGALGAGALFLPVRMVMTREVITCAPNEQVLAAVDRMTKNNILHLPVVRNGKLLGCIEKTDALQILYDEAALDFEQLRNYIFKTGGRY